tara:strand:- start:8034 stop:8480 length:447 start_codon:yes stop_codon:yes gene_type:complete
MISDKLSLQGRLDIVVTSPDGVVKEEHCVKNVVVTTGKNYVASRMAGTSASVMSHMSIGTGTTAAAASDTTLGSESARVSLTSTTVNNNDVVYVATFPANTPSSAAAITEAGIFNAGSSGSMLCRTVFSPVNKQTADSLTITWTVTAS